MDFSAWRAGWRLRVAVTAVVLVAAVGVFAGGYFVGDDSSVVDSLTGQLDEAVADLDTADASIADLEAETATLRAGRRDLREQLRAERSLNGNLPGPSRTDIPTDLPWGAAGTVGDHTLQPTALEQHGERWLLTVTAKNDGDTPSSPFCGDAGAVLLDSAGREYSGDSVLGDNTANCGDDLQPGLTATYQGEFRLPPDADPAAAAIYGDYEYSDEAKIWAVP